MSDLGSGDSAEDFADAFVHFVRAFGLLDADRTPCGAAMSTAEAHAVTTLRAGRMPQRVLGERLHLTKSTTSRLVDQLRARGWVDRVADPGDGRVQLVGLTDQGERVAADVSRRRAERLTELLDRVPKAQRRTVIRTLHLLEEASHDLDHPTGT
ncbi:MarR family transcriptional regulator [Streptomyces sp. TRM49041]|uniref:MarR family winged helix-turn-helix transcriptional regulator n=1 Tax=Streptomyces sp. TRM49041 TaxID=2603216 RepID=UPI0011F03330|nr:MarR family transcriptional regulator [Streptomyces sp. TRM49041]